MRVFLAGGTGVIGGPLIRRLVAAGHEVTATTRRPERTPMLRALGAEAVVADAFSVEAFTKALVDARPEAVIHQLTDLPQRFEPKKLAPYYERLNFLRGELTSYMLEAARKAGARHFVFQSIAFMYALKGPSVLDEDAPLALGAPEPFATAVRASAEGERQVLEAAGIEGVVLRYGQLYGPGTYFAPDGSMADDARRRRLPIVGEGSGIFSFLHVEDAAASAVCALERGKGIFNVADDEPAPVREWVPVFCERVGAPRPWRVPVWAARLIGGEQAVASLVHGRGADNSKAKAELGWTPVHPSWRESLGLG